MRFSVGRFFNSEGVIIGFILIIFGLNCLLQLMGFVNVEAGFSPLLHYILFEILRFAQNDITILLNR
jgi:energy-converting hydrogenase Eha subunit E